jgi:transcriptional regulator with XRE-family HTH domain
MKADHFSFSLGKLGWTQAEFSRRTGVTTVTVSRWMNGHSPFPKWVAEYLRVVVLAREILGG